jgi:hypothetical protein
MMKIREPGGVLLVKVKCEVNRLYLLHLKFRATDMLGGAWARR